MFVFIIQYSYLGDFFIKIIMAAGIVLGTSQMLVLKAANVCFSSRIYRSLVGKIIF